MSSYPFFSVIGLEIEYMLVNRESLDVAPKSDALLTKIAGKLVNETLLGEIALSNELVMHVIECKNNGPKPPKALIAEQFHQAILALQPVLETMDLQLLPTGSHPWMNPQRETQRWPHDNREIYNQYDCIFNCQGQGWSNLQSMHVNLPFNNDQEFSLLHNSIRLLLPLLPAIAASSPILEGKFTGMKDARLHYYGSNQQKIPQISGAVIPEFVQSTADYREQILVPMFAAIKPWDPEGILQHDWLNSRGVIPKFDYNALEIRIIDSQECPDADIAIALAVQALLQSWCERSDYFLNNPCGINRLKTVYDASIFQGLDVIVDDAELCKQWQLPPRRRSMCSLWSELLERFCSSLDPKSQRILEQILIQGNLSERILAACKNNPDKNTLKQVYQQLGSCLINNQPFYSL